MPVPHDTPMRSRAALSSASRPLAAIACPAAAIANCVTRSRLAASASLNRAAGFQSMVAPTCTPERSASSGASRRMPERPAASDSWNCSRVMPSGETTPAPVTATRRMPEGSGLAGGGERGGDVALEVGERLDRLQVLVGHADAELLLDLEHELDEAERVDAQRVQRRGGVKPVGIDRKLFRRQLADAPERVHRG